MQENNINAGLSLYDFNKSLVKQLPNLTDEQIEEKKEIIKNFLDNTIGNYYMLLCNEKKDYTIFNFKDVVNHERYADCANCLMDECIRNRGCVRALDITEDKCAIEIWIYVDDECFVYYFFPYDKGVIEDF